MTRRLPSGHPRGCINAHESRSCTYGRRFKHVAAFACAARTWRETIWGTIGTRAFAGIRVCVFFAWLAEFLRSTQSQVYYSLSISSDACTHCIAGAGGKRVIGAGRANRKRRFTIRKCIRRTSDTYVGVWCRSKACSTGSALQARSYSAFTFIATCA